MKKATLIIWVIVFGFIALVIFQNQTFFLATADNDFHINLGIKQYTIPPLPNAVLLLIFFFTGLLIAYLFSISARFKAKRTIKKLNTNIASHIKEVSELKAEINRLKGLEAPVDEQADTVKLDMDTTQKIPADSTVERPADKTIKYDTSDTTSNPADTSEENSGEKKE